MKGGIILSIPMSFLTEGQANVQGFYSVDNMLECLGNWADRNSLLIDNQLADAIRAEYNSGEFIKIQVPSSFSGELNVVHYTNTPISVGITYTLPYYYYGVYRRVYFRLVKTGNTISYDNTGSYSSVNSNILLIIGSGMTGDPVQIQISNLIVQNYVYPITYRPTNCSFPNAPTEANIGDTVVVPVTFPDGYGLVNESNIYVTNNGVVIPSTYSNGQLTFTMPDPS